MNKLVLKKSGQRKRVLDAQENFDKIMKKIKPFIKNRKVNIPQTSKWEVSR